MIVSIHEQTSLTDTKHLRSYPTHESVPRIGETIMLKDFRYRVVDVWHVFVTSQPSVSVIVTKEGRR